MVAARISIIYALGAGVWIYASDALMARFAGYPQHVAMLQVYKGWTFVGVTALLLYGLIGTTLAAPRAQQPPQGGAGSASWPQSETLPRSSWRAARTPVVIFLLLAGVIAGMGYLVYGYQKSSLQQVRQAELLAIADTKVDQITTWLTERRKDAELIARNPFIALAVSRWLNAGGGAADEEGQHLLAWLTDVKDTFDYSAVMLLDAQGQVRLGVGASQLHPKRQALALQAMERGQVIVSDLHWRQEVVGGTINMDLIAPLRSGAAGGDQPIGAVFLKLDPERYLFPLIQTWPTPSPSAETLLVRQEGDQVLYLNELRHRKNTALTFRLPSRDDQLPAALAVKGQTGAFEGVDYRQVRVLAVARAVPETSWFLVAKVDADEVYAPVWTIALFVVTLVGIFILCAGAGTVLWWRQQHASFLARYYQGELERKALIQHFDYLTKYANDIILLMDAQGQIIEANARAVSAYGYPYEELLRLNARDLREPEVRSLLAEQMTQIVRSDGLVFETIHLRKDGASFPVEASSRLIEVEGKQYLQSIIRDITERKNYQEKLAEAERLVRSTLDALSAHICVLDETGTILMVNQAWRNFAKANGIDPSRVAENADYLATCVAASGSFSDEAARFAEGIRAVLRGERHEFSLEYPCHSPSEKRWFLGKVTPFQTLSPARVVIAHENITARKRAEEKLAEQKDLLETVLSQAADAIVVCEAQGNLTLVNAAARRLALGNLEEKAPDRDMITWGKGYYPNGRPVRLRDWPLRKALRGETTVGAEARMMRPDGSYYDVLISAAPLRNAHQEIIGAVATYSDITERKLAENALRASEAHLRAIANAIPDVLLVLDEEGRYIDILTSQPELLYTDPASLKGRLIRDVMPTELAEHMLNVIRQTLSTRQTQIAEYELRIAKAGKRFFEARTAPVEASGMDKPVIVVVARDITQRKVAEERLRQAQKMEAVGQLTGGVAHDFNNLLAIILGNLELLDEALTERPELRSLVQRSLVAVDRGTTFIHRLLAFSRRQPLQPKPIDLNQLVRGMTDLLRRTLGETIQVHTVLAEDLAQTVIDSSQFENALLNLALNARDAMPNGGTLTLATANRWLDQDYVAAHPYAQPGTYVMLAVSDTGEGMPPAVLEHAFEPFFTTKEFGSGLGLSMVYGLVKQSGGHLNLDSEVGKGTTIRIYLPRAVVDAGARVAAPAGEVPAQRGRAETILVVEDDSHVRQLAVNMLHGLGYQPVAADTAEAALQVLASTPQVALLFTDVGLPGGMSGMELAAEAQRRCPGLKVLFTSGYTEQTLLQQGRLPDGAELLTKPYRRVHLATKLHAVLGTQPPGRS